MRELKSVYILAILYLLAALPLGAASTGTSALHTPQGSGAGTANGDYVTAPAGLDTFYRYFIEVPSGLSRLVVELFDADFGAGGAAEATAQRDRARGGFDSTVSYSLIDPSGTARTTRFTTGSTTLPTGGDNAWLSLYDGNGNNVRDNFGTAAYTNNDGNNNWSAAWIESDGGGGGATGGAIQITGGQLRLQDGVAGTPTIEREADLSGSPGLNLQAAYLSFDFSTSGNLEDSDDVFVQVSSNGGGSWTTLENFSNDSSGSRNYDITGFIADNTRVRFEVADGYTGTEFFFVDNLEIHDGGAITAGHWELRVDSSNTVTTGNDINALGIRAHDGTSGSGGTELNVYYDSHTQLGVNPPSSGETSRSYTLHPYITSGCTASENDHDYDSNSDTVGSVAVTPRGGGTTQTFGSALLSNDNVWDRNIINQWGSDTSSTGYGAWTAAVSITNYTVGGTVNGNYANLYFGNFNLLTIPPAAPTANPTANTFRVYLPTDAGGVPAKPYLEQLLAFTGCGGGNNGPNPPDTGQTSCFTVTVRMTNPAAQPITFSTPSNIVTANIPGSGAVYNGGAQVSQGTIVSQPSIGGTGNITWNPGTLAAGGTALLSYRVNVTPTSNGQRIPVTATPASGNGTRAQYVDETGNTSQTRATYLAGPVCELAVTENLLTEAVVSSFRLRESAGRGVELEWTTASEVGTAGFWVERWDPRRKLFVRVHEDLLAGLLHADQGGTYRFADEGASPYEAQTYRLVEVTASGGTKLHGPYARRAEIGGPRSAMEAEYERAAHPTRKAAAALRPKGVLTPKAKPAPEGLHLTIEETGLYYLSTPAIAAWLGLDEKQVEKKLADGKMVLTQGGQPVAYRPDLDPTDKREKRALGMYFYGQALDNLYSATNTYRLEENGRGVGLLMPVVAVSGSPGTSGGTFAETLLVETDSFPATAIAPDPESDYWFWEFLQAGDPTFGHHGFALDAPGVDPAAGGSLRIGLHGATTSGVPGEHRVEIEVNGTLMGETSWDGVSPHQADFPLPPGLLLESANQVEVTASIGGGAPFSIVYIDGFALSYQRSFTAAADRLTFTAPGGALGVAGFTTADVRLLEVSNPRQPRWIEGALVEPDGGGGQRLAFTAPGAGRFFAAAGAALKTPSAIRPWSDSALRANRRGADYLVITAPALRDAATRLANYRAASGLSAAVVDTDQIYDEISFGVANPHAIRAFAATALVSWQRKPRYLALAGEGTLDYRNLLGFGDNVLPPIMVQAEQGLFPSDNRIGDATGDGLPELAVGRIPVLTPAELDAYLAKIAAYEAAGSPAWGGLALLLADNDDGAASFSADSDELGTWLDPSYSIDRIYLASQPLAAARSQLFAAIAQGRSFINYLGHGGLDRLSAGGLLASADVASLANGPRLPVLTAMTCTVNRFAVPGVPALGELLVKSAVGGAAAVWGPSGLSDNAQARRLAERFYRQTSQSGVLLGDRIVNSLKQFRDQGGDVGLFNVYNLLGDPGLRVRTGPEPTTGGGSPGE